MKKVLVSFMLAMLVMSVSAIPWSADVWRNGISLVNEGKLVEARAYLDTVDAKQQNSTLTHRVFVDYKDEAIDTTTHAKLFAVAEGYYSAAGRIGVSLKSSSEYATLWVYVHADRDFEKGLAYYQTLETPSIACVNSAVAALYGLKRVDEAIALAVANKSWYSAFRYSNIQKDKVKTFEYGSELLLGREQKAATVNMVLNAINNYNYKDTIITDEVKIDFYKEVDKKYRKFMAIDPTTWKPILATVLHSLKALGVEVVE